MGTNVSVGKDVFEPSSPQVTYDTTNCKSEVEHGYGDGIEIVVWRVEELGD